MTLRTLQVLGTSLLLAIGVGCEGPPARSKWWRHAPSPSADQVPSQISPVLDQEREAIAAMAARGDTFTVWLDSDPGTLVPMADSTVWTRRIARGTIFESLLAYQPGESLRQPGSFTAQLAESWQVLDGGRALALSLRTDAVFHDGRKLSSVDVQFSLDAARSPRTGADHLRRALSQVSAVELAGPRAVRIYLHRPDATVLRALAEVPILPAHTYQKNLGKPGEPVVGTGPYRLVSREGGTIRLERFDDYYGEAPAVNNLVFRFEPDAAAALSMLRGGEIDLIDALIPSHYPGQAQAPGVQGELLALRLEPPEWRYLVFNTRRPPFDDERVRCAVSALINRKALVDKARGLRRAISGPIWPGGPGDGPAQPAIEVSLAQAERWLEDAGWTRSEDGVRRRNGQRLLLTVLVSDGDDPERDSVLEQLNQAGFVLDTRQGSVAVLDNRLRDGEFDVGFVEWRGWSGADLAPLFASSGWANYGRMSDARIDDVFARLREAWRPADRWQTMDTLGDLISQTCPVAPLTAPHPYGMVSRRVSGIEVADGWIDLTALSLDDR